MILNHIPALLLQKDAALRLLRAQWTGGRNAQPLREAANRLVETVQQQGTLRLLLELDNQPDVPVFDQLWLSTVLLPQALRLPVRQLVIILSSKRIYNRHVLESLLAQFQLQIRADIQFFTSPEPALDWLTDNSPRVPELLAEWAQYTGDDSAHQPEPTAQFLRP